MAERPLRVVLADDEPIARRGIERLLSREEFVTVVAACDNGEDALTAIRAHRPDLAFLDIEMPGMTGLDVARALHANERPAIVFVTAFDRFAIEAFDMHAVDYLLKPFDDERFHLALKRARERLLIAEVDDGRNARLDALLRAFTPRTMAGRIAIKVRDRIIFVAFADIDWCEAADNYVTIISRGQRYLMRETMRALEQRLDPALFVRIHRSTIVNLSRVRELQPMFHGDYQVLLHDGTKLTLSRSYRDTVLARVGA